MLITPVHSSLIIKVGKSHKIIPIDHADDTISLIYLYIMITESKLHILVSGDAEDIISIPLW